MRQPFFCETIHRASSCFPYLDLKMENLNYASHFHREIELVYVVYGHIDLTVNHRCLTVNDGDLGVIMPGEIHSYTSVSPNRAYIIKITPPSLREEMDFSRIRFFEKIVTPANENYRPLISLLQDMVEESREKSRGYNLAVNRDILDMMLFLLRHMPYQFISAAENVRVQKQLLLLKNVDEYVKQNYQRMVPLAEIAEYCQYSVCYFAHFFKETAGQSFVEYLTLFRAERAASMIALSGDTLTEIAFDCGFNTVRSFNRAFRKYLCLTPSEYRRNLRNGIPGEALTDVDLTCAAD